MSEISKEVHDLSKMLQKGIKVGKDGSVVVEEGLYEKTLSEGLSIETIEAVSAHNTNVLAAAALALGESSIPVMEKHPDIKETKLVLPLTGKDKMTVGFERVRMVNAFGPGQKPVDGEPLQKPKYGAITSKIDMYATHDAGSFAAVRGMLSERAQKKLGE